MALPPQTLENVFLKDNLINSFFLKNDDSQNCFFSASSEDISYENVTDETLFFEGLSDTHVHHVPPFNVEKISKQDYRLTILMPGVSLENVQSEQKKDKMMISVTPPLNFFNLNAGYELIHFGIFDVLRPTCPFEFQVNLPEGIEITKTVLEEGLLKIDLRQKT
ncbi:MAG: hypothetical protein B7Y25_06200 [Alphaproteobacteria bacterium 16-39-46]|nr:MAG: hypothetical protein B7Y25_06200 [Alphaproteobacteria bacterium 16-39-46]OZA42366.1 MAG: hypothetical protein B7X84_06260 [Alphaproteobacteria bacterium 17-39-52]HQS84505.1 hypothetical protein [Alphaproteobacteria bacterium]HQS94284.1 hypothetical protein [Alphaproteobacteria bacterium]